jgi:hypothetical protein
MTTSRQVAATPEVAEPTRLRGSGDLVWFVLLLAVASVLVYFVVGYLRAEVEDDRLRNRQERLARQLDELQEVQRVLDLEIQMRTDAINVEREARERLGLQPVSAAQVFRVGGMP